MIIPLSRHRTPDAAIAYPVTQLTKSPDHGAFLFMPGSGGPSDQQKHRCRVE